MAPSVSICVPVYDGLPYLAEALESAIRQTFEDLEIIIVDDGSVDGSWRVVQDFAKKDRRVRALRNDDRLGLVGNWNRCVELAQGEWVKFLFQDDLLCSDAVEKMLETSHPEDDLVVCARRLLIADETPEHVRRLYEDHLSTHDWRELFDQQGYVSAEEFSLRVAQEPDKNCLGEPTAAMIRRSVFSRVGLFREDLVSLCDWEFLARVAACSGVRLLDEELAVFRVHEASESALNRRERAFATDFEDPLKMRQAIGSEPIWAPVRKAALAAGIDLASDRDNVLRGAAHRILEEARGG